MLFLYRLFCGVLEIEFSGIYPEKVMTLCAQNKINIWSARFKNKKIRCKITVKDFLKLPAILKKSGIRVHIRQKSGFPFFIKKYKKRMGIFSGIVFFFAFLYIMSGFVWIVNVEGNQTTKTADIIKCCNEIGIKEGVRKKSIDTKNSAQLLLLKNSNLAWGSINIEGCRVTVNVSEIKNKRDDGRAPSNLVASADGIITHVDIKSGNCIVKVGDTVCKGDLLVSGIIETENETRFVKSVGKVTANTETDVELKQPLLQKSAVPSGKTVKRKVLTVFGINIPLYLGRVTGEYKTKTYSKSLIMSGQEMPVTLHTKEFIYLQNQTVKLSTDNAKKLLEKRLKTKYKGKASDINYILKNGIIYLNATLKEEKDISVSENLILGIGK